MKKICFFLFAVVAYSFQMNATEGALNGRFTINANGDQVAFSQGNLQYNALVDTWQFAENQYDAMPWSNFVNRSETFADWIDVFYWGTSGYNEKYPYMTSTNSQDYGDGVNDISGTNYDWGVYNAILNGGNEKGLWRTLTADEWNYLLDGRENASILAGQATVNGIFGAILLPDGFEMPIENKTFTPKSATWSANVFDANEWSAMEQAGAVFLPAQIPTYTIFKGSYWTATSGDEEGSAYIVSIIDNGILGIGEGSAPARTNGSNVRLVKDIDTTPITEVQADKQPAMKIIRDGMLLIERNCKKYNALGAEVK